ncbi:hypothetical protein, partial [uncultured Neptuniibacter sp.]|uniref:hypothetical protein n=1 Tax=uncultured Neptuniibacter sp. TaxID=502143 RepID=UPI0032B28320
NSREHLRLLDRRPLMGDPVFFPLLNTMLSPRYHITLTAVERIAYQLPVFVIRRRHSSLLVIVARLT